jgi:hypothetical protein
MILLITPAAKAQGCAQALQEATTETTQVAATLRQAASLLRAREYSAVVIDQSMLEVEPDEGEMVLQHIGLAIPVHVNFAISGTERIVRELRAALQRHKQEVLVARQEAEQALRNELKGTVTALLLCLRNGPAGAESAPSRRSQAPRGSRISPRDARQARHGRLTQHSQENRELTTENCSIPLLA